MKKTQFEELMQSVEEMDAIARNRQNPSRTFKFPTPEVKTIREKAGLSQARFALLMGVSVRTLQNWEQGHRAPQGPAVSLLRIFESNPEAAIKAIHKA